MPHLNGTPPERHSTFAIVGAGVACAKTADWLFESGGLVGMNVQTAVRREATFPWGRPQDGASHGCL